VSCPGVDRDHVTLSEICSPESARAAFPASVASAVPLTVGCWFMRNMFECTGCPAGYRHRGYVGGPPARRGGQRWRHRHTETPAFLSRTSFPFR